MLHAAVWIDHQEAKIFHVDPECVDATTVHGPQRHVRRHRGVRAERGLPGEAEPFYREVVQALEGAEKILVLGPATAKHDFVEHVYKYDQVLAPKIVGVQWVDDTADGEFLKFVRGYFRAAERKAWRV